MAVGSIGGISVKIDANIDGFIAGVNKVNARVSTMASNLRSNQKVYAGWATAGVLAAGAVATAMVKSQMDQMDALAKTSDALKINQKQLQSLQHVAELTGTGANQLSTNLERMQRRIGEVARKGGQAEAALNEINLSAKEMISLPADEQLVKISEAFSTVDNASVRASIAMDLFGRDGVRMLKMMEQLGQDGLAATTTELEKMGVLLSRIDTAKVEQANDAMFKSGQALEGMINRVAVQFSPLIEGISNEIINAAKETDGFGVTIDNVFTKSMSLMGFFADMWRGLEVVVKLVELGISAIKVAFIESMRVMTVGMEQFVNVAISGVNKVIDAANIFGAGLSPIEDFTFGAATMFTEMSESAIEDIATLAAETNALALKKMPSEALDEWVAKVQEASEEAAKAATSGTGGNASALGLSEEEKAALAEKLEAIRDSFKTESELKQDAYDEDLETLRFALENKELLRAEYDELEKARTAQHNGEIIAMAEEAAKKQADIDAKLAAERLRVRTEIFSGLSNLMNTESRKLFEIGKVAAISNSIITGIEAAVVNFKKGSEIGGPWVGAAYAAASVATTLGQINQIKSTSFGSSSTGQSYSDGTVVNNTSSTQEQTTQTVDVNVTTSGSLVDLFNIEVSQGAVFNTGT